VFLKLISSGSFARNLDEEYLRKKTGHRWDKATVEQVVFIKVNRAWRSLWQSPE
jgi:hypothetical protein